MADRSQSLLNDPFVGLTFWVEIDGLLVAQFCECSGLNAETEFFEYAEGGQNGHTHKLPVRTKWGNVTLKRGVNIGPDLFEWFLESMNGNPKRRRNVSIQIYDPRESSAIKRYDLLEAFPVRWVGPDLRTEAGAVTIETLEFAHNGHNPSSKRSSAGPRANPGAVSQPNSGIKSKFLAPRGARSSSTFGGRG